LCFGFIVVALLQIRLKTAYFGIFGLQQRVFAFDDVVLGKQGNVFALDDGIFRFKRCISVPDLRFELSVLHFGLLQLQPYHSRLLHPLKGRRLRFNEQSSLEPRKSTIINPATL
jgi:hypothetical protein